MRPIKLHPVLCLSLSLSTALMCYSRYSECATAVQFKPNPPRFPSAFWAWVTCASTGSTMGESVPARCRVRRKFDREDKLLP